MTDGWQFGVAILVAGAIGLVTYLLFRRRLIATSAAIVEANRRFEATFEQAAVGIAHLDAQGRWLRINARYCEITGYPFDELVQLTLDDITHPLDVPSDAAARASMMAGDLDTSAVEKRYVRKNGEVIWVNATRSTIRDATGRPEFFVAVVEEITARKQAEIQLTTGESQYRATFDSAVEAMAVIDDMGWIQSVNPALLQVFGYAVDELIGRNIKMLMPKSIATQHDGYLKRFNETGVKAIIGIGREVTGQRKDGTQFPLDLSVAEWQRDGQSYFTGVMRDVTARKAAEAALIAGEAQYRAIFDSAVEAMAVIDAKGNIQSINPALERTFGYVPDQLIGKNIKMLMPKVIAVRHDGFLKSYRETGVKAIIGIGREVIGQHRDGTQFPLDLSVAEWQRDGQTFFTGAMRDIRPRKDAEVALRASQEQLQVLQNEFAHLARVNDLGEMAAAIAHEINQPLTAIVNYLNSGLFMATEGYSEDAFAETEDLIRLASQQALRAGDIVRRLREFVGHGIGVRSIEAADRLVDASVALALIDARSGGIAVERISGAGDAEVEVDAVQIQQVLVNLLRNAVEAMRAEPSEFGPRLTIATAVKSDLVEISVADNGPGIEPAMLDRLFEPFVTTKAKGMGMGLSVCRRLIESHGGTIDAKSAPGAGATFKVRLPRYRSSPEKRASA